MTAASFRAVGEAGLLVGFGDTIDDATFERVLALDRALANAPPAGMTETVPAYTTLLILFDPCATDHRAIEAEARARLDVAGDESTDVAVHVVPVCYDEPCAPDLAAVAARTGISPEAVIACHAGADYRVFVYGFAPGYAYLGGVPEALHLPRKPAAARRVPVGSVMIAGGQCLITTLPMPTGWWVIGRTALTVLDPAAARPFRFAPGDRVRFERVAAPA